MRWSVALPADRPGVDADELMAFAAACEAAGIDAVHATEHPFPPAAWVEGGGHHALDPLVALSLAAAATGTLRLHTNVLVAAYRNPFLTARAVGSLDALSGGRVILGLAAGYLEGEFAALGAPFEGRGRRVEDDVRAMRAAWSGGPVTLEGQGWSAAGNVMLPTPAGSVPVWIGGNSPAAMRRAVAVGQGWMPFTGPRGVARAVGTTPIRDAAALGERLAELRRALDAAGRPGTFDVCTTPATHPHGTPRLDAVALRDEAAELEDAGVTWLAVKLPGDDRSSLLASVERFGAEVVGTRS